MDLQLSYKYGIPTGFCLQGLSQASGYRAFPEPVEGLAEGCGTSYTPQKKISASFACGKE
jgi:hypothetical protein